MVDEITRVTEALGGGDMGRAEAMLVSQAHALQALFASCARRMTTASYLDQFQTYGLLALKAQNQCRATLARSPANPFNFATRVTWLFNSREVPYMSPAEKLIIQACTASRSKHIRSRDDLSFTIRDDEGRLINWLVLYQPPDWDEGCSLGKAWFSEVIEITRHNAQEGFDALRFAVQHSLDPAGRGVA